MIEPIVLLPIFALGFLAGFLFTLWVSFKVEVEQVQLITDGKPIQLNGRYFVATEVEKIETFRETKP